MDKIAIAFILSALLTVCVSMNAPEKKNLQPRQANVNCADSDLAELDRLAEVFAKCKNSICRANQTGCSCCSGQSDDCCNSYGAGLELYRLCKDRISRKSRKTQVDTRLILTLFELCKLELQVKVNSGAGIIAGTSFGGILVLLLFTSFL